MRLAFMRRVVARSATQCAKARVDHQDPGADTWPQGKPKDLDLLLDLPRT